MSERVVCKHCGKPIHKELSKKAETDDDWYWSHAYRMPQCNLTAEPKITPRRCSELGLTSNIANISCCKGK